MRSVLLLVSYLDGEHACSHILRRAVAEKVEPLVAPTVIHSNAESIQGLWGGTM